MPIDYDKMAEAFAASRPSRTVNPLSVELATDQSGCKQVLINGTNFASNIVADGVSYVQDKGRDATLVTVTFVADEFSNLTRSAGEQVEKSAQPVTHVCDTCGQVEVLRGVAK